MAAKRMELLKEVAPDTRRVAVIFNPQHFDDEVTFARRGAESLGIALTTHPIDNVGDLDAAQNAATAGGADSVFIISSRLTGLVAGRIAQYGQERRLPVYCFVARVCGQRCFVVLRAESGFRKLPAIDANRLARVVVTFTRGLAVMERAGYGRKQLKEAERPSLMPWLAMREGDMSAIGTKQTSQLDRRMSAFGGKADMPFCTAYVR